MYLHIGQGEIIPERRILGVFDLDRCTAGKRGREFLSRAEAEGAVVDASGELPRSFVLCDHPYHRQVVYLTPLSTDALRRRRERGENLA